jgi:hypothetical protein
MHQAFGVMMTLTSLTMVVTVQQQQQQEMRWNMTA